MSPRQKKSRYERKRMMIVRIVGASHATVINSTPFCIMNRAVAVECTHQKTTSLTEMAFDNKNKMLAEKLLKILYESSERVRKNENFAQVSK